MTTEQEKQQVIKDEKTAEKVFQAGQSHPTTSPTTVTVNTTTKAVPVVDVVAERKKADAVVEQKKEALTKANETVAKAHDELMTAQREAAKFPVIVVPPVVPPVV